MKSWSTTIISFSPAKLGMQASGSQPWMSCLCELTGNPNLEELKTLGRPANKPFFKNWQSSSLGYIPIGRSKAWMWNFPGSMSYFMGFIHVRWFMYHHYLCMAWCFVGSRPIVCGSYHIPKFGFLGKRGAPKPLNLIIMFPCSLWKLRLGPHFHTQISSWLVQSPNEYHHQYPIKSPCLIMKPSHFPIYNH